MSSPIHGKSELAVLTLPLPMRERSGVALVAAYLALEQLRSSKGISTGVHAFELARRWFDGESIDPGLMQDALHDEDDRGVDIYAVDPPSEREIDKWIVLSSAFGQIAYHMYKYANRMPGSLVSDVMEDCELDSLDKFLRTAFGELPAPVSRAADYLRQFGAPASFAQLKAAAKADLQ